MPIVPVHRPQATLSLHITAEHLCDAIVFIFRHLVLERYTSWEATEKGIANVTL